MVNAEGVQKVEDLKEQKEGEGALPSSEDKLYKQSIDYVLKYIESNELGYTSLGSKTKAKAKKVKKKEEPEIPSEEAEEEEQEESVEEAGEEQTGVKKKKRRRKNRKKKVANMADESDQEASDEPNADTFEISRDVTVNEEAETQDSYDGCLSRLSDNEFERKVAEFKHRLARIEEESKDQTKRN